MITEPKKYTFDVEFRPEGDLISNAARARQRKVHTQEELDAMLSRARHDGMKMGQVRAAEQIAAALDLPRQEVELLLKVHRIVLSTV